jgi:hypothetical protein
VSTRLDEVSRDQENDAANNEGIGAVKRLLLLCLAAGLLALPATASAYVALHGRAKIAVVYDGYANGLGDGLGNPSRPPSNAAIHECFDAWQSTANSRWAIWTTIGSRHNRPRCRPWASNGWTIMRVDRRDYWIADTSGDETHGCHIRGEEGQPSVPRNVARDFFGPLCRSFP